MKRLLQAALVLALLAPLALRADEPGHNYTRWEKEISAYEHADATNPPPKGGIEFIGSSYIAKWKTLAGDFPGQPVFDRGFGGSEIVDSTHFAPRVIFPYAPSIIFLRAGGNDLWAGKSAEQVFADFKEFAETIHAQLPGTKIVYISQSPSPARWKQLVADYIQGKPYLEYIETYDMVLDASGQPRPELYVKDRLHLNAEGYKLLTARVRPHLPH